MDFSHSFPKLEYEAHGTIRGGYKYADDLINPNNWGDNINKFNDKINSYIDERDSYADIKTKNPIILRSAPKINPIIINSQYIKL